MPAQNEVNQTNDASDNPFSRVIKEHSIKSARNSAAALVLSAWLDMKAVQHSINTSEPIGILLKHLDLVINCDAVKWCFPKHCRISDTSPRPIGLAQLDHKFCQCLSETVCAVVLDELVKRDSLSCQMLGEL